MTQNEMTQAITTGVRDALAGHNDGIFAEEKTARAVLAALVGDGWNLDILDDEERIKKLVGLAWRITFEFHKQQGDHL